MNFKKYYRKTFLDYCWIICTYIYAILGQNNPKKLNDDRATHFNLTIDRTVDWCCHVTSVQATRLVGLFQGNFLGIWTGASYLIIIVD